MRGSRRHAARALAQPVQDGLQPLRRTNSSNIPAAKRPALVGKMFARFMEGENPTEFTFAEKLNFLAQGILSGNIFELVKPGNASVWRELSAYFSQPAVKAALAKQTAGRGGAGTARVPDRQPVSPTSWRSGSSPSSCASSPAAT